jgi:hypothetical protein
VDANHYVLLAKIFDKKMNSPLRVVLEKQSTKKKPNLSNSRISKFLISKYPFQNDVVQQKINYAIPWPFSCQKSHTFSICEKYMIEVSCNVIMSKSCVSFVKKNLQEVLLELVEKTKQEYALPKLKECNN